MPLEEGAEMTMTMTSEMTNCDVLRTFGTFNQSVKGCGWWVFLVVQYVSRERQGGVGKGGCMYRTALFAIFGWR